MGASATYRCIQALVLAVFLLGLACPVHGTGMVVHPPDSGKKHHEKFSDRLSDFVDDIFSDKKKDKPAAPQRSAVTPRNIGRDLRQPVIISTSPHMSHHKLHKDKKYLHEEDWDNLQHTDVTYSAANSVNTKGEDSHPDVEIFGFHPYWMGSTYNGYLFNFLTTVAYFSYDVDPLSGSYRNIYSWRNTKLIDLAKDAGQKVVLTVTCMGAIDNDILLSRKQARQTLIDSVISLLKQRKADGVCLDFEDVPRTAGKKFNEFVVDFSKQLKAANPAWKLSMTLPAIDFYHVYDVTSLTPVVDQFIVMAYDYITEKSRVAGPNAPLSGSPTWGAYSVNYSVSRYLDAGIPPKKILLGVPYYGTYWQTKNKAVPSDKRSFLGNLPYNTIRDHMHDDTSVFDEQSSSEYFLFPEEQDDVHQIWFDGVRSLDAKYQFVLKQGLGGVAIWTLGYDHGYDDLWSALIRNFSRTAVDSATKVIEAVTDSAKADLPGADIAILGIDTGVADTVTAAEWVVTDFLHDVREYGVRSIVIVLLIILSGFFLMGFLLAFTSYNLAMLFSERLIVVYFTVGVILAVTTFLLTITSDIINDWVMFGFGVSIAITGTTLLYLITRKKKELP